MSLGHKKGHLHGENVTGGHSTVIDNAHHLLKKMDRFPWFESVRPQAISRDPGGKPSVSIRRHHDATHQNTLTLIFRQADSVQKVDVRVRDLQKNIAQIVLDIMKLAEKQLNGIEVYDRTAEKVIEETRNEVKNTAAGSDLLAKWGKKKR